MRFARPPHARAASLSLIGLTLGASFALGCVPENDLDAYSAPDEPGAALPSDPAAAGSSTGSSGGAGPAPSSSAGTSGNGAAGRAGGSVGIGGSEGVPVLPLGSGGSLGGEGSGTDGSGTDNSGTDSSRGDAGVSSACAPGELRGPNGHCYFFDPHTSTWSGARSACQARGDGWDLVSVRSPADSAFLGDQLTFQAWIGASVVQLTWVWAIDNRAFWQGNGTMGRAIGGAYVNWNSDEPNGGALDDCARALPRSLGSVNPDAPWADLACSGMLGAICEEFSAR